jgi:hypothetical protein
MAEAFIVPLLGFVGTPMFFVIMGVGLVGMIGLLIYLRSKPRDD